MGCFPCAESLDENEETTKKMMKMKDENRVSAGSIGKQPLSAPSVFRASRVASASEVISEAPNVVHSEESSQGEHAGRNFTFSELSAVTGDFHKDCLIGEGGFGAVYKGRLQDSGQVVAVKRLNRDGLQGDREFDAEVKMLSSLHHQNLVKLIGFCSEGDQRLLVYEFMPLGSLEDHLHDISHGKVPLDWNTRMKIVAGAAIGIKYLHSEVKPPVIYRDIKASNILLDEGYFPKLSDFGLARSGPDGDRTHVSTRVMGTYGYCAPEYAMTGQLTVKSDIYSFGVVLLEIITGRKAVDYTRPSGEQSLLAWARPLFMDRKNFSKMVDPLLQGCYPARGLHRALVVAAACVQENAASRPTMSDVVTALHYVTDQVYDPNAATLQNSKVPNAATPQNTKVLARKTREGKKNLSILSDNQPARQSLTHCSPDFQCRDLASESNSCGSDGSGRMQDFNGSQMEECQNDSPAKKIRESPKNVI